MEIPTLVTIVIAAGGAPKEVIETCLLALNRHKGIVNYEVMLVAQSDQAEIPMEVAKEHGVKFMGFITKEDNLSGSRAHASLLDRSIPLIETPFVMTLDVDCFPIADGWLEDLMRMLHDGADVVGILHPYQPPQEELSESFEKRIRTQLCWDNTHVACQLLSVDTLRRLGVKFSDGDDTGLAIPNEARKYGMKVTGFMPTACPNIGDAEINRDTCVIFGDKVYHHGGASREAMGKGQWSDEWKEVRDNVIKRRGAEWLLQVGEDELYRYKFDREQEVSDKLVSGMLNGMYGYLQENDKLF